nr:MULTISPECIES: ABC transporter substrate-binding protein [unclassified Paenibacillus]
MVFVTVLSGCGTKTTTSIPEATSGGQEDKSKPDKLTPISVAIVSNTTSFLPLYVAEKKGMFEKYNLEVDLRKIEGGVLALRGLQAGDFQFIASLAESIMTSVNEGANMKIIGSLSDQTLYSVFVSPEINTIEDLRGKAAAVLQPGNGVDIIMRWWLKENGLEPDQDIRMISAGGTPSRLAALRNGQVQVTVLQPPNDINGEQAGMKRFVNLSDELQNYNHTVISSSGTVIQKQPEVARAFMAATADAIAFIKDPVNSKEAIQIAIDSMGMDQEIATKSLDFVKDSFPDQAKINVEGIKWAINAVKETGSIKNDLPVEKVIDERFYMTN